MKKKTAIPYYRLPGIILFTSICLITGCQNNDTDKAERERLQQEQEQQRELVEERKDTTYRKSPIFEATLQASNEAKEDTQGSGSVTLTLEGDSIHMEGQFSGLSSEYAGSYIHRALQSERVQQLDPTLDNNKTSGSWDSSYKLDKGEISMLKKDSLYISVYSADFDDGELRGQLTVKEDSLDNGNNQPEIN
ncbi:CHRD domain-containing protein [Fodinibius sp.]|uniref:CHRD domain-containing protein n=1 Tax=Fodinibius sp. TaxID=1872440 RepID=UPI0035685572